VFGVNGKKKKTNNLRSPFPHPPGELI